MLLIFFALILRPCYQGQAATRLTGCNNDKEGRIQLTTVGRQHGSDVTHCNKIVIHIEIRRTNSTFRTNHSVHAMSNNQSVSVSQLQYPLR